MAAPISCEMAAVAGVSALAQPDFLIEVEAVAVID
jgi:enamine deaminase RidA (YjgF/YER057c/UK114 family)